MGTGAFTIFWARRISLYVAASLLAVQSVCLADVSVAIVDPNTAVAQVSLSDGNNTYAATVTVAFDQASNLSPSSLGLTAELIDPAHPPGDLPLGVSIDPAFP